MSDKDISLIVRETSREAGIELDFEGLDRLREIIERVGNRWPASALAILKEKNVPLLERLVSLEHHLDSLILIPSKPAILQKEFKAKLEEFEKTIEMCIDYANRHIAK